MGEANDITYFPSNYTILRYDQIFLSLPFYDGPENKSSKGCCPFLKEDLIKKIDSIDNRRRHVCSRSSAF